MTRKEKKKKRDADFERNMKVSPISLTKISRMFRLFEELEKKTDRCFTLHLFPHNHSSYPDKNVLTSIQFGLFSPSLSALRTSSHSAALRRAARHCDCATSRTRSTSCTCGVRTIRREMALRGLLVWIVVEDVKELCEEHSVCGCDLGIDSWLSNV